MVETDRLPITVRFERRTPKATNKHSTCVKLTAFPHQKWLRERTSMLRDTLPVFFYLRIVREQAKYCVAKRRLPDYTTRGVCVCMYVCIYICAGLFEIVVGVWTTFHTQKTWDRRCNPMWFLSMGLRQGSGLCSSSSYKYTGTEGMNQSRHWNHHQWHATNSLERTR